MHLMKQDYKSTPLSDLLKLTNYACPIECYMLLSRASQVIPTAQDDQHVVLQQVMKKTQHLSDSQLWHRVNHLLWIKETQDVEFKKMSNYYALLTNWISFYEQKLAKIEQNSRCFIQLANFLKNHTSSYLERQLLVQQCLDDIKTVVSFSCFWEQSKHQQMFEMATYENLQGLLRVLQLLVHRSDIYIDGKGIYELMDATKINKKNYDVFVYKCLAFLMRHPKMVFSHELELTKLVIKYSMMANEQDAIKLMNQLLTLTSKPVKFASMCDYQTLGLIIESQGKQQLQQALQNMHQYRQLTIKKVELGNIETVPLNTQYRQVVVSRGGTFITHFQVIRPKTLLLIQFQLDQTIDVTLSFEGNTTDKSKNTYFQQQKCTSRSLHIEIIDCGLHSLTFGNTFSWVNSKRIRYSIVTYLPKAQQNHDFASLLQ